MITGINHITLSVKDIDKSFDFYTKVMLLKPIQKSPGNAYFLAGESSWIEIVKDQQSSERPLLEYTHVAFSVPEEEFAETKARLEKAGARKWQEKETEGESFYFLDPDGHKLEIHTSDLKERIKSGKWSWGPDTCWYV